jgi:O-antigen ligase
MQGLDQINSRNESRSLLIFLLPLFLFGFMGSTVTFLHYIFTSNTRWIVFIILMLVMIAKGKIVKFLGNQLAFILYLYVGWCFFTTFWSAIPILSFAKSCLLAATVFTMVLTGIEWIKTHAWDEALDYIWVLALIALSSGFLGKLAGDPAASIKLDANILMYQGLINGSNMFGSLLAMSIPYLLWKTYKAWFKKEKKKRLIYFILTASSFYFLILTLSRASILAALITLLGLLMSLKLNKKIVILLISIIISVGIMIVHSDAVENLAMKYIYKTNQKNLFYSREAVWRASYDSAMEGGWFGLGYGVSFGQNDFNFERGLTSIGYGREKGNSQLGIIEETGFIGLGLYVIIIGILFCKLFMLYFKVKDKNQKVMLGIVTGIFLGMIAQSLFEAWWDAPGGPESVYFWLLVGVIRGLEIVMGNQRVYYAASRIEA